MPVTSSPQRLRQLLIMHVNQQLKRFVQLDADTQHVA